MLLKYNYSYLQYKVLLLKVLDLQLNKLNYTEANKLIKGSETISKDYLQICFN